MSKNLFHVTIESNVREKTVHVVEQLFPRIYALVLKKSTNIVIQHRKLSVLEDTDGDTILTPECPPAMIGTPPPIPPTRLLAEIATLSKVNAVRMKVLVKQVVQYGLTGEIDYDKVDRIHGMNLTFVTTATTDAEALALLEALGMPFKRK